MEEEKNKEIFTPQKADLQKFEDFFSEDCCSGKGMLSTPCTKRISF